ncbi:TIGR02588 family protein [Rhizobium sp. YIM 134829]|uniref:TIGR02588 family protein n=1 Tax=Rhizobium sp. YIM 134829 TaxID=3390453 RepID=UPI00397E182B
MAGKASKRVSRNPHWIEWATGLLSTVLVVGLIAVIAAHGFAARGAVADLSVSPTTTRATAQGFALSFIVVNGGKKTAAEVPVTGRLMKDGQPVEEREVAFDYVPAQSQAAGALIFTNDPSRFELELRASGYRDP